MYYILCIMNNSTNMKSQRTLHWFLYGRIMHLFLIHNNGCMNFFSTCYIIHKRCSNLAQIYPAGDLSRWFQRCCECNGYKFNSKVGGTVASVAHQSSKIGISLKVASYPFWNGDGDVNTSDKGTLSNTLCAFSHLILATAIILMGFPGGTSVLCLLMQDT